MIGIEVMWLEGLEVVVAVVVVVEVAEGTEEMEGVLTAC